MLPRSRCKNIYMGQMEAILTQTRYSYSYYATTLLTPDNMLILSEIQGNYAKREKPVDMGNGVKNGKTTDDRN